MTNLKTRWWWVRHAPVVGLDGVLYGSDDVSCDTTDSKAFRRLASQLPVDAFWIRSHLLRTHQTAEAIRKAGLKFPTPVIEAQLGEQDFGDWQGLSWGQMELNNPQLYKEFWERPAQNRPPNGESFSDQIARVSRTVERVTAQKKGDSIVAIAHGGTIRAAIAHAIGLPPEKGMSFTVDNLSITCLEHFSCRLLRGKGQSWRIVYINRPSISS